MFNNFEATNPNTLSEGSQATSKTLKVNQSNKLNQNFQRLSWNILIRLSNAYAEDIINPSKIWKTYAEDIKC